MTLKPTWKEMDCPGDPITGDSEAFETLQANYKTMDDVSTAIVDRFKSLNSEEEASGFKGQAAKEFVILLDEVTKTLDDLPRVARDVQGLLKSHANKLAVLEEEAATAYEAAVTNWKAVNTANDEVETAREKLRNQTSSVDSSGDEVAVAFEKLKDAETAMEGSHKEWRRLDKREWWLDLETVRALADVDLGDLGNDNWLEKTLNFVASLPIIDDLIGLVAALARGDFIAALWRLRDLLGDILLVLAVVALVAAIFLSGGTVLAFLAAAGPFILAMATAKLVIEVGLFASNTEDPDNPGRKINKKDLALSTVSVLTAGAGNAAGAIKPTASAAYMTGQLSDEAFLGTLGVARNLEAVDDAGNILTTGTGIADERSSRTSDDPFGQTLAEQERQLDQGRQPSLVVGAV